MRKITKLLSAGVLVLSSMAANATSLLWDFSYAGTGVTASGQLTTDSVLNGGAYLVTGISGQRNGESILALTPAGTVNTSGGALFSNNLLYPAPPVLDYAGITFQTLSGYFNLCFAGSGCGSSGYQDINGQTLAFTPVNLTVTQVPEPATLGLMGLGLLGLGLIRRKKALAA
jgi:hypothetical protein